VEIISYCYNHPTTDAESGAIWRARRGRYQQAAPRLERRGSERAGKANPDCL
jgi:hypothetical protein